MWHGIFVHRRKYLNLCGSWSTSFLENNADTFLLKRGLIINYGLGNHVLILVPVVNFQNIMPELAESSMMCTCKSSTYGFFAVPQVNRAIFCFPKNFIMPHVWVLASKPWKCTSLYFESKFDHFGLFFSNSHHTGILLWQLEMYLCLEFLMCDRVQIKRS